MGTSSIYDGRKDSSSLLPDDFNDDPANNLNDDNQSNNNEPDSSDDESQQNLNTWQAIKSNMSKYISSGGERGSARHITGQYVKAFGGSRKMTANSTAGIKTASGIGNFLNSVKVDGIIKTLHKFGIYNKGKTVQEVFSSLIDIVAIGSNTKEDIVAREAAQEALAKVYDYVESNNMELESLDSMSETLMNEVLCEYIGSYIWLKMMNDLESRFEKYMNNLKEAMEIEQQFKDYIFNTVKVEFESHGNIVNQDVRSSINDLYVNCLSVLEETI